MRSFSNARRDITLFQSKEKIQSQVRNKRAKRFQVVLVFSMLYSSMSPRSTWWKTRSWPLLSPSVINPASWPGYAYWVNVPDSISKSHSWSSHWSRPQRYVDWVYSPRRRWSFRQSQVLVHGLSGLVDELMPPLFLINLWGCLRWNALIVMELRPLNMFSQSSAVCYANPVGQGCRPCPSSWGCPVPLPSTTQK